MDLKGNEGMVRCVEREGATAGGRWEAPLAKLEQKLKRCRISFIKEDDVQRQEEGAVVVRDAAPPKLVRKSRCRRGQPP